ncbi:ABC transporter permease [Streptomyces armeniacus]|uniref:ABC transporter permease n=1 Tax=Streptomyces armeniacus TaxID=83291 RepID=A0A345XSW6_9ACTN|nr:ABC transporter permease [Streptomyces armeniacus]AXK34732.1 ABC transporter permease [Streptomyces armeniacus]
MAHTTRVLRSEWTKVRSVRSTLWTLLIAAFVTVGLSALICGFTKSGFDDMSAAEQATFDPTFVSFAGMSLGQLAMIAFGVLVVSNEYSTGMIRSSLSAVPQRGMFMFCKIAVAIALVFVVGMATSFLTFLIGQELLGEHGTTLGEPNVLRAVIGGGLYMTLIALFTMGVTFVMRSPMLAFGVLMPFFFIISGILGGVSATKKFAHYLPDQAGTMILTVEKGGGGEFGVGDRPYGPWGGLFIMVLWVLASLLAGYLVLKKRDA